MPTSASPRRSGCTDVPHAGTQNRRQAHRHAVRAYEDWTAIVPVLVKAGRGKTVNAISHHLRHTVFRTGLEVDVHERVHVERNQEA